MANVQQIVPTPQEIAEFHKRKAAGLELMASAKQVAPLVEMAGKVQDRVAQLEKDIKKKRLSAVEMADKVQEVFKKNNFSAVEELVKLVTEKTEQGFYKLDVAGDFKTRVHILETLLEYEAPKLKSVEVTGEVNHSHEITILRFGEDGSISREKPKKAIDIPVNVERMTG